ncbi:MAG: hypothetical protein GY792_03185 [Gammaproteobacteria bacterium]|nr:hypothetical protein [Gammaproteobacteria bacterium]
MSGYAGCREGEVGIESFSLGWALMLLMAIIPLPIVGLTVLQVLAGPWSPFLLVIGAFLVVPFAQKRIH